MGKGRILLPFWVTNLLIGQLGTELNGYSTKKLLYLQGNEKVFKKSSVEISSE